MTSAYDKWRGPLDAYYKSFSDAWVKKQARPPKVLYHYTSAAGLHGILDSRKMWATHVRFLNDPSELDYSIRLLRGVLAQYRTDGVSKPVDRLFADFDQDANLLEDGGNAYAICFCAKGDVLSQWRAYGQGGGGYAIGFRSARMKFNLRGGPHFWLWRVIYDEKKQVRLLRGAIDAAIKLISAQPRSVISDDLFIPNLAGVVRPVLANYCMTFKSSAFSEEQEWRAIYLSANANVDLKFRPYGKVLIPYYALAIGRRNLDDTFEFPVDRIRYGPTLAPDLAERSLALLLERYDLQGVAVEASGVPLRD